MRIADPRDRYGPGFSQFHRRLPDKKSQVRTIEQPCISIGEIASKQQVGHKLPIPDVGYADDQPTIRSEQPTRGRPDAQARRDTGSSRARPAQRDGRTRIPARPCTTPRPVAFGPLRGCHIDLHASGPFDGPHALHENAGRPVAAADIEHAADGHGQVRLDFRSSTAEIVLHQFDARLPNTTCNSWSTTRSAPARVI